MYKWRINITLKGSGEIVCCKYEGYEKNPNDVVGRLFSVAPSTSFIMLNGLSNETHMFIVPSEIAAIEVRAV